MTTTKNPGLGARSTSVSAALAASSSKGSISVVPPAAVEEEIVATSVRLPKSMHDALTDIVYAERKRGNRISIHSLILEGTAKVIEEKK
jgi:hypothetical protein